MRINPTTRVAVTQTSLRAAIQDHWGDILAVYPDNVTKPADVTTLAKSRLEALLKLAKMVPDMTEARAYLRLAREEVIEERRDMGARANNQLTTTDINKAISLAMIDLASHDDDDNDDDNDDEDEDENGEEESDRTGFTRDLSIDPAGIRETTETKDWNTGSTSRSESSQNNPTIKAGDESAAQLQRELLGAAEVGAKQYLGRENLLDDPRFEAEIITYALEAADKARTEYLAAHAGIIDFDDFWMNFMNKFQNQLEGVVLDTELKMMVETEMSSSPEG